MNIDPRDTQNVELVKLLCTNQNVTYG